MLFFDFLYYSIYSYYASYKEKGAESTSVSILAGLQSLNVVTLVISTEYLLEKKVHINAFLVIGIFLIFEIYNYRRHLYQRRNSAGEIKVKWMSKTDTYRSRTKKIMFLYVLVSIICCFGVAILAGSK